MKLFLYGVLLLSVVGCVSSTEDVLSMKSVDKVDFVLDNSTLIQLEIPINGKDLMRKQPTSISTSDVGSLTGQHWLLNRTYGEAFAYEGISGSYSVRLRVFSESLTSTSDKQNIMKLREILSHKIEDFQLVNFGEKEFLYHKDTSGDLQTVDLYFVPLAEHLYLQFYFEYLGKDKSEKMLKEQRAKSAEIINSLSISML